MSAHAVPTDLFRAPVHIVDAGNAGSFMIDRSPCVIDLISVAAETRTLARPTRDGAIVTFHHKTDGGDITLTVTGGFNETGDTTFVFSDPGQFAMFQAFYDGTNYYWRLISHYAIGNQSPTEAGVLDGLLANVTQLNNNNYSAGRVVTVAPGGSDATLTVTAAAHDGKTVVIDNATKALTINLPAATGTGCKYRFFLGTSITNGAGNSISFVATGAHIFGNAIVFSDNAAQAVIGWAAGGATTINFNGTTKGGIKGDMVEIEDVATSKLMATVIIQATGTEATPFG